MKHFLRLFVVGLMSFATVTLSNGAEISWKVVHPFRFFTEQSDFRMHMDAYDEVMRETPNAENFILAMEHKLNDVGWLKSWIEKHKDIVGEYEDSKGKKLYAKYLDENGKPVLVQPEKGWASLIERRQSTCWDENKQSHLSCHVDSFEGEPQNRQRYVKPIAHTVVLSLKDAPEGICEWATEGHLGNFSAKSKLDIFIDGKVLKGSISASCKSEVLTRIPYRPDLSDAEKGVPVKVTLPDGKVLEEAPIWVRDRLVVGFGDSYSSGEGNPDTPVTLETFPSPTSIKAFLDGNVFKLQPDAKGAFGKHPDIATFKAYPVALNGSRAQWLDRNCHRSAYSYHLRSAIQLAIRDSENSGGHTSLTFLGYACSGAEISAGILGSYSGKETNSKIADAGYAEYQNLSQVNRLNVDLCLDGGLIKKGRFVDGLVDVERHPGKKIKGKNRPFIYDCAHYARKIDLLIISVGGNDVGFAPLIAYVILGSKGEFPGYSEVTNNFKNSVLASLANVFGVRHDIKTATKKLNFLFSNYSILNREVTNLPLARGIGGATPVILTGFPNFATDEWGVNCGSETDSGRKAAARLDGMSTTGVLSVSPDKLNAAVEFAKAHLLVKMAESATDLGWTFVNSHIPKFRGHGFCAKNMSASTSENEDLRLPFYAVAKGTNVQGWFFHSPKVLLPYAKRQRWIRSFHDECLMGQFDSKGGSISSKTKLTSLDYLQACLGGPMHPTAEGHAVYADATYLKAKELLGIR